ncbi:MAG: PorT family protein [Bacteroidales bacterium]|nr:PorT family protein [Bacteroidales bacterium]
MKKPILTLLLIALASMFYYAHGQRVMGVLIGGFNATHVEGDDVFGFRKIGANAGAAAVVPFGEKWTFSIETIYNMKGSHHKEGGRGMDYRYRHDYNQYKLVLNYVEVPVLLHYIDRTGVRGGMGLSYGRLIEVKEWEDNVRIATTTLNNGPYDLDDYSALFDVQIPVYRQLKVNVRYAFSLFKIRERQYQNVDPGEEKIKKQYNRVLSFRVLWYFNEESSRQSRQRGRF